MDEVADEVQYFFDNHVTTGQDLLIRGLDNPKRLAKQ